MIEFFELVTPTGYRTPDEIKQLEAMHRELQAEEKVLGNIPSETRRKLEQVETTLCLAGAMIPNSPQWDWLAPMEFSEEQYQASEIRSWDDLGAKSRCYRS